LAPSLVVELWEDQCEGGPTVFAVLAGGLLATAAVHRGDADGERQYQATSGEVPAFAMLRYMAFHLAAQQAQKLKIWAHTITPEGDSQGLPVLLEVAVARRLSSLTSSVSVDRR
jgi:hypothetical protein